MASTALLMLAWECDYPHSDSAWAPLTRGPDGSLRSRDVTDADEINKISHENALRWYSYDPLSFIPKEKATVASLRSKATDVDTGIRSRAAFPETYRPPS
jgi:hypothetical protein